MSRSRSLTDAPRSGFPRVSGDEPGSLFPALESIWFSPRERG